MYCRQYPIYIRVPIPLATVAIGHFSAIFYGRYIITFTYVIIRCANIVGAQCNDTHAQYGQGPQGWGPKQRT